MTCIKTGAVVYFENYDYTVPADIYQVTLDTFIIRWNPEGRDWNNTREPTHRVGYIINSGSWFHREDLGITVVPALYVSVLKR